MATATPEEVNTVLSWFGPKGEMIDPSKFTSDRDLVGRVEDAGYVRFFELDMINHWCELTLTNTGRDRLGLPPEKPGMLAGLFRR